MVNKLELEIFVIDLLAEKDATDQVILILIRSFGFMENGYSWFTKRLTDSVHSNVHTI